MKKIIVTGATSMIGTALIEECVKQNVEVYAVIRSSSGKQSRLPDSSLIHLIDCSLETLDHLPELIPAGCDTFTILPGQIRARIDTEVQNCRAEISAIHWMR